jgi:glycosyltransferase involved in cell wall biosynthesis
MDVPVFSPRQFFGSADAGRQLLGREPRVLYVTPYWPLRVTCASELRAIEIARTLQAFGQVDMVVVDAEGGGDEYAAAAHKEFPVACCVAVRPRPNQTVAMKLNWLLNPRSLYPHGCGVYADAMRRVEALAESHDLVWFAKLRTPNMFPRWHWPHAVADIDDVPSTFEASVVKQARGMRRRVMAWLRYWTWRRRDALLGDRFNVLAVCSAPDRRYLASIGVRAPVHVIPNGFSRPAITPVRQPAQPPRIGFIGIFDYAPNLEGLRWFVRECWPIVKRELPDARLRLVGRLSDGPLKPEGSDIDGLGWVADTNAEMATWSSMIVPILMGAGTRGKIAHAFSVKCPVISTTLGAHGYEAHHGRELLLCDTSEAFASACVKLSREPQTGAAIAERAWAMYLQKFTWEAIRPCVWAAATEGLLQQRGSRRWAAGVGRSRIECANG